MLTLGSGTITYQVNGTGSVIQIGEIDGDCELDMAFEAKTFSGQSLFAKSKAYYAGKCVIKAKKVEFKADNLSNIYGLTKSSNAGIDTYALGQTTRPKWLTLTFTHTRSDDGTKTVVIKAKKVYCDALVLPFPKEDFVLQDVEFELLADATGSVADIEITA